MSFIVSLMIIGLASLFSQWIAWALRLPSILFLLVCGLLLGPVFHFFNARDLFGHVFFPMVAIAVAIILFEGSLKLKFSELKGQQKVVRRLVTIGFLTSAVLIALCSAVIFHLSIGMALLFGVLASISGPTVVVPLLRSIRPESSLETILRWEGLLIDPIGAIFAVVVFSFMTAYGSATAFTHVLVSFFEILLCGIVFGSGVGFLLGILMRGHWVPEYLRNLTTLALVISVYVSSDFWVKGSGLLAVTVMGVFLANMKSVHLEDVLDFKENLSILLISGIFILLATTLNLQALVHLGYGIIILLIAIQFLIRPLAVCLSTVQSSLNLKEKILISWVAPRGIVAAAVAALYSIKLRIAGHEHASILVSLVFAVIICTVVFQSLTARFVAKALGLAQPEPRGFMIVGANRIAIAIGEALKQGGLDVLLISSHYERIEQAKAAGLSTYYGNAISEHADRHLDLVSIGHVLAITNNTQHNVLTNLRYQREFGKQAIYHLITSYEATRSEKHHIAEKHAGQILFDPSVNFDVLSQRLAAGACITHTRLTETLSFADYKAQLPEGALLLFIISPKGHVDIFSSQTQSFSAGVDWIVLTLIGGGQTI